MASVKREPATFEKYFQPCTKVHWRGIGRNADVAKIAGAVSGRDVHTAAQSHSKMRKVSTYTDPLMIGIECRSVISRVTISKFDVIVNKIANCLCQVPTGFGIA